MCDVILRRIATQQKQQQRQCNMKSGDSVMSYFYSDKDKLYKISKSTQNSWWATKIYSMLTMSTLYIFGDFHAMLVSKQKIWWNNNEYNFWHTM